MACPNFKKIKNTNIYHWPQNVRGWDGYTISPIIPIAVRKRSKITLKIESERKDMLELEDPTFEKVIEPFDGEKEFNLELKVKLKKELLSESDIEELPESEMSIPIPKQTGSPRTYIVKEYKIWPYIRIMIKITGKDSKEPVCEKYKQFGIIKYVEVILSKEKQNK